MTLKRPILLQFLQYPLRCRNILIGQRGSMAVEFAILCPITLIILFGIMSYGGYFWIATTVQQLANDSARAAIAGLSTTERQSLAQSQVTEELQSYGYLSAAHLSINVTAQTDLMTVSVAYDASQTPFWAFAGLIPMPSSTIARTATIKLAGY